MRAILISDLNMSTHMFANPEPNIKSVYLSASITVILLWLPRHRRNIDVMWTSINFMKSLLNKLFSCPLLPLGGKEILCFLLHFRIYRLVHIISSISSYKTYRWAQTFNFLYLHWQYIPFIILGKGRSFWSECATLQCYRLQLLRIHSGGLCRWVEVSGRLGYRLGRVSLGIKHYD